jgi:phosphosulfolactate synthase
MLNLPKRNNKPRKTGITSLHDISLTTKQLEFILEEHHEFVDIAKLGIGTAYITPNLNKKIEIYKSFNIEVYFGGTLFEKFYSQDKLDLYKKYLEDHQINTVEISTGTIDLDIDKRVEIVKDFSKDFMVLSEVGSKDSEAVMAPSKWLHEIESLFEAGSSYVITEGRDSGTAGMFRSNGEIRTGLLDDILNTSEIDQIIFEAPTPASQIYFINKVGSNVNLGNINPYGVLQLETQRQSLRSDTFFLER